ncbi:hypothetical protein ISG33_11125 [Glaciecola sp. MH2013]|uniref:hypothetical protein n=1 Tax=Glaciecola sp. MH2013 TaxID=2785524 RepID=UPI00189F45B6|nr:hypothetical protein [Glaciecola sp. MH2013]MBF7073951.1 hypothetical protein [Glaciecola sp. MH2013]
MNSLNFGNRAMIIMITEFELTKYRTYVKNTINKFKHGEIDEFGFISEADEARFHVTKESTLISYNLWIVECDDWFKGSLKADSVEFMKELDTALTCMDNNKPWAFELKKYMQN